MTFQHYDANDIKSRLDGQGLDIAERYFGAGKRSGRAVQYVNPTVHQKTGSFTVYPDGGFYDHKTGDSGSVLDLIALGEGLDIKADYGRVLERAAGLAGVGPLPADQPRCRCSAARPQLVPIEPDTAWRAAAEQVIQVAKTFLWSGLPQALTVLDYLHTERRLTDKTIRDAQLGYNPKLLKTDCIKDDGKYAYLMPGIVIPWRNADRLLTGVRVRTITGSFARALGVPDDLGQAGKPRDKYLSLSGSKMGGALYGAARLAPGHSVILVEGEFDALAAGQDQALDGWAVVTGGSANSLSDTWVRRWGGALQAAGRVYLALDNDSTGTDAQAKAQARLSAALADKADLFTLHYPEAFGKDMTDYLTQGGDLGALLDKAVPIVAPKPVTWPAELPLQLERGIMTFTRSANTCILLRVVCAAAAAGLDVDGVGFTVDDLVEHALQVGVSRKQLYSALDQTNPMTTVLFQNGTQYLTKKEYSLLEDTTVFHSGTIAEPSRLSGRRAVRYVRRPYVEMVRLFLDRVVAPRAIERHFPDPAHAPITSELLTALGADSASLDAVKTRLTDAGLAIDQAARNAAKRVYLDWQRWLSDESPAIMPDGEAWGTVAGYKAAIVRRSAMAAAGSGKSIAATVRETGLSKSAVLRVSKQAGVMREQQLFSRELAPGKLPVPGYDHEAQGFAKHVIATDSRGEVYQIDIDAPNIRTIVESERQSGATIEVIYQGVSIPRVLEGEERVRFTETQSRRRANCAPIKPKLNAQGTSDKPSRIRFWGIGHNPEYARRWLAAMLALVGYQWRPDCGDVIDMATGQIISAPTHNLLIGLILHGDMLARQPEDFPDTLRMLAAEMGGLLKARAA